MALSFISIYSSAMKLSFVLGIDISIEEALVVIVLTSDPNCGFLPSEQQYSPLVLVLHYWNGSSYLVPGVLVL